MTKFRSFAVANGGVALVNTDNVLTIERYHADSAQSVINMVGGLSFLCDTPFEYIRAEMDPNYIPGSDMRRVNG